MWFFLLSMSGPVLAQEEQDMRNDKAPLAGQRVVTGTVEEIRGDQAKVNTGEGQPRFVPMNIRQENGLPDLQQGDQVEITLNEQNLVVDVRLPEEQAQHRLLRGILVQPLVTGHDKAVIQQEGGNEESFFIRPLARSKVASLPVGTEAVFFIDENDQIADAVFGNSKEVQKAHQRGEKKSPLKGNFKKITGVLVQPLENNSISIQENGKKEQNYEVRPLIQEKLKTLSPGKLVVLFIDDENKVTDVSFSENEKGSR